MNRLRVRQHGTTRQKKKPTAETQHLLWYPRTGAWVEPRDTMGAEYNWIIDNQLIRAALRTVLFALWFWGAFFLLKF